ncbi:hypothetical protein FACS1894137_09960 [Spirochaetia bacterium]|nr:hypothetical protein FACS1894137_09960 [Spirochaetia bacterium]
MVRKHFLITRFTIFLAVLVLIPHSALSAQAKYALIIGNSAYSSITRLSNPVNDATDMKAALEGLGFQVDLLKNGSRVEMERAVSQLKTRLSGSKNALGGCYGFFFYAGHGVQSQGENFLLPVDADIIDEAYLPDRAVNVQAVLSQLNAAGNELNVVVLDACRDNPYSWNRSGSRGLTVVGNQPVGSIIVYATSAGSIADDGQGRNGLFTSHLLKNLKTPGLEVYETFRRTMDDVRQASNNRQAPAIYSQLSKTAYLGTRPPPQPAPSVQTAGTLVVVPNSDRVTIYNDSECYEYANFSDRLPNITKTLKTGSWTIDNGYEEKRISIRQGITTNSTLTPYPGYDAPDDQEITVTDRKNKSVPPEWVASYLERGSDGIDTMPQYRGRNCIVSEIMSFHLPNESLLEYMAKRIIVSSLLSSISQNDDSITSSISNAIGFSYEFSANTAGDQRAYESSSKIIDTKAFENFLDRIDFRIEDSWWLKRKNKYEESYVAFLLVTVSKAEFSKIAADYAKAKQ